MNTALRAIGTLLVVWLLSSTAFAQSVLNFPTRPLTSITVTNTSLYAADIKFTLYNADGSLSTSASRNPISRRAPAKGQVSVEPAELFRLASGARQDTWIQATSAVTGLEGFYFSGDFLRPFTMGGEASEPQTVQTIPYIPSDPGTTTSLLVTNPSSRDTNVNISFFSSTGGDPLTRTSFLPSHAQMNLPVPTRATSVRVSAEIGILATAITDLGDSAVPINGQSVRARSLRFVAPYFKNREGTTSQLVLVNSTNVDARATVSFFAGLGSQPIDEIQVLLKPNVSTSPVIPTSAEGWLLVESTAPINGMVVVASGSSRTTLPLQQSPAERMFFSRSLDDSSLDSILSLVGTREREAVVTIAFSRPDGTTIAKRDVTVSSMFRVSEKIRDLFSLPDGSVEGYISVQSSVPIYALELMHGADGSSIAGLSPQELSAGFQASAPATRPQIAVELLPTGPDGVRRISIAGQNIDNNATLSIAGRVVPMNPVSPPLPSGGRYTAELPELEWGYINVKVRAGGLDSNVVSLPLFPSDIDFIVRSGQAMYQKVEVGDTGLDLSRTVLVPIRHARVEVYDAALQQVISVSESDEDGAFRVGVPNRNNLLIRVVSRLRSSDVKVLDNTSGNRPYMLTRDIDPLDPADIELVDTSRQSGAFNILDNVQRGNALVALSDPQIISPPLTIYWSDKNNEQVLSRLTGGWFRTTFFSLATNTAYILGDRNTDSDEFDDSVILHEYAHMLASRFSRDDSPGGPHFMGDILDPRVAWSEGWANFFSSAVRGTSIYIDSKGPGVPTVRYDLEEDSPANDRPGYWSEASVHGLLWDLLDENQDNVDTAQFPFASIWNAITDLRSIRYVYLPYFLETFLAENPEFTDALRAMVIRRGIDFQPDVRPSVVNPFPRPITVGETRSNNDVDSFTSKRTNLASSSHFYSFSTPYGGAATITLNIDGLGPANNPNANDLDLVLYDGNGRRLEIAEGGGNGQPEVIAGRLNPGTYYVEVRSYYTRADTNTMVYNSGRYRLSVQVR